MEIGHVNMGAQTRLLGIIRYGTFLPRSLWGTLVFVSLFVHSTTPLITCGKSIISFGGTFPTGDIVLEHGSGVPLEITCVLDPDNKDLQAMFKKTNDGNSSKLPSQSIAFYKNAEPISDQYVTIINSTAAQMRIPDPPAARDAFYYCFLILQNQQSTNHSYNTTSVQTSKPTTLEANRSHSSTHQEPKKIGVCLNSVSIGYKPLPVTNFSCISNNWDSLTCNWTKPLNPVKTTYKISFRLPGRAGGRFTMDCPTDSDILDNTCYWDLATIPMYRQPYEYYFFTLFGENPLGNSSTIIRFHHYGNVIPASPSKIIVTDTTQSSVALKWSIGSMAYFPRELIHKIEYRSRRDSSTEIWHSVEFVRRSVCDTETKEQCIQNRCHDDIAFNITDLKHPFTDYDFNIYIRSSAARGEDKWSAPGSITVKTKPTIPKSPPVIDIGSFECVPSKVDQNKRDVIIYWKDINDGDKHGESFEYLAYYTSTTTDNKTTIHRSTTTYDNRAVFEGLSTSIGYNFTVYSSNSEGLSLTFSFVYVPSESQKVHAPLAVTLMTFDGLGVFELSWENANNNRTSSLSTAEEVNYYTLFWCETYNNDGLPLQYQCNGHINWIHVPNYISCHNITGLDVKKNYRFAISSNRATKNGNDQSQLTGLSSGMARETCRVLFGKSVQNTMNVRVSVVGSKFMALKWSLSCTERIGFIDGYHINYCPMNSMNNSTCNGTMLSKTISKDILHKESCFAILTNLKPRTTYMVAVSIITNHGKGLIYSESVLNTTLAEDTNLKHKNYTKNNEVQYFF